METLEAMNIDNGDPEQSTNRNDKETINDGIDDKSHVSGEVIYITFKFHQN